MSYKPNVYNFSLQASRGLVLGTIAVSIGGYNPEIDPGTAPEDIWTGGGIWLAPTAPRIHDLVSTDAGDTGAGAGARTVRVFGLQTWDGKETSELITMNGLTPVPTVNSYVMINGMRVETSGNITQGNAGDITATAQVDGTVTAVISIADGQTSMAIYGWPSLQTMHFTSYSAFLVETGGSANEIRLQAAIRRNPDQPDTAYADTGEIGVFGQGTSYAPFYLDPPVAIPGPAIAKVRCLQVSANNAGIGAALGGFLVDKV